MNRALLLVMSLLLVPRLLMAEDYIGIFSDASGTSCELAPGYSTTATVVHFSGGSTGSRFRVALSPGSALFGFNSPFVTTGLLTTDMSVGYGQCLVGTFAVGTIAANWLPGVAAVVAIDGMPFITFTDCQANEFPAIGGYAYVGLHGDRCFFVDPLATEHSTWGHVKALYR